MVFIPGAAGNRVAYGFSAEATPGTESTGTYSYFPIDADQTEFTYDAARKPLLLAFNSQFSTWEAVELEAKGSGKVSMPLFPSIAAPFLALWGLGGGNLGSTIYHTTEINRVNGKTRYPGCLGSGWKITAGKGKPVTFDGSVDFTGVPDPTDVVSGGITYPTREKPYVWASTKPATAPGFVADTSLTDLSVEGKYNQFMYYGNHGSNLPSELIPTYIEIMYSFTCLFKTNAAYRLYVQTCQTPDVVSFAWQNTCGGVSGPTCTIAIQNAVYDKVGEKQNMKSGIMQSFSGFAILTQASDFSMAFA